MLSATRRLLIVMLTVPFAVAHAAVPDGLQYQGYLTDPSGQAVNADTSITFSVYAVDTGGSPLWFETMLVPIDSGLFSVTLGNPANPFPPGLFDTPLYLGIRVAGDSEMTPRRPLTSVGFSFKAEDADRLQGHTAAELNQAAAVAAVEATVMQLDTVLSVGGSGEAEIVAPGGLEVANAIPGAGQPDLVVGGLDGSSSGDDGVISSAPGLPGSDLIFQTNDAFAIELDSDGSGEDADFVIRDKDNNEIFNVEEDGQLRLHGATSLTAGDDPTFGPVLTFLGETSDQAESGRIRFRESPTSTNLRGGYMHYDGAVNKMHIGVHDTGDNNLANDQDIITIERSSGQVGIGTASPNRELTVNDTDGSSDAVINIVAPNRELIVGVNQSSGGIVGTITNNDLQLRTNNTNRLVIDNAGDVEIREDLVVEGDIHKDYGGSGLGWGAPFAMARVQANGGNPAFRSKTANVTSIIAEDGFGTLFDRYLVRLSTQCTPVNEALDGYIVTVTMEGIGVDDVMAIATCNSATNKIQLSIETRNAIGHAFDVNFNFLVFRLQ